MTNMNKQKTAVQWQFDELQRAEKDYKNEVIDGLEYTKRKYEILEQANQIFKEQIEKAYEQDLYGGLSGYRKFENGQQYYKEIYGK